jgi:hypothetical protein
LYRIEGKFQAEVVTEAEGSIQDQIPQQQEDEEIQ